MTTAYRQKLFGSRKVPHTVIIARGDTVRHFVVRPWLAHGAMATLICAVAAGAWAGLRLGDDAAPGYRGGANEALTLSYELRIASLRSEVDKLTTRGFLDRQKISSKVDVLLDQQAQLAERYAKLQPLLDRARSSGLAGANAPIPEPRPVASPDRDRTMDSGEPLAFTENTSHGTLDRFKLVDRPKAAKAETGAGTALTPDLVRSIGASIDDAEAKQFESLDLLTSNARSKTQAIGDVLRTEGVGRLVLPQGAKGGEGGPFVPVPPDHRFDAGLMELSAALDLLDGARAASQALPLAAPVTSTTVSSSFGVREDPFLGKAAMHTGIDFVAESGTAVTVTAPGTVTFAGENGGYGQMVEVDHGNGLSTRYGHLSEIAVRVGDRIARGGTVGRVGSTGRSTGPHLHYEVRRTGEAVDPSRFLKAGRRISALG